jgi:hypothetical protein
MFAKKTCLICLVCMPYVGFLRSRLDFDVVCCPARVVSISTVTQTLAQVIKQHSYTSTLELMTIQ